jgi:hypothetical protein
MTDAELIRASQAVPSADTPPRRVDGPAAVYKRNVQILRGLDGTPKKAVTVDVACRFGGVSRRAIEKAVKKGALQAEGDPQNRRVLVDSLLKYFPPEDNAN